MSAPNLSLVIFGVACVGSGQLQQVEVKVQQAVSGRLALSTYTYSLAGAGTHTRKINTPSGWHARKARALDDYRTELQPAPNTLPGTLNSHRYQTIGRQIIAAKERIDYLSVGPVLAADCGPREAKQTPPGRYVLPFHCAVARLVDPPSLSPPSSALSHLPLSNRPLKMAAAHRVATPFYLRRVRSALLLSLVSQNQYNCFFHASDYCPLIVISNLFVFS